MAAEFCARLLSLRQMLWLGTEGLGPTATKGRQCAGPGLHGLHAGASGGDWTLRAQLQVLFPR